jgi:hypothetical protein
MTKCTPEYQREWRRKNPERVKVYEARKKAGIRLLKVDPFTREEIRARDRERQQKNRLNPEKAAKEKKRRREYEQLHREKYRLIRQHWREKNRARFQATSRAHALKKYGISVQDYDQLLESQGDVCAVCAGPQPKRKSRTGKLVDAVFCVDHNHVTGEVRGLLCTSCNLVLGNSKDNPGVLRSAIAYLEARCPQRCAS